jgi:hypothetical protein
LERQQETVGMVNISSCKGLRCRTKLFFQPEAGIGFAFLIRKGDRLDETGMSPSE